MNTLLFPNTVGKIASILFAVLATLHISNSETPYAAWYLAGCTICLFITAFSKEKIDDELMKQIRLEASQYAFFVGIILQMTFLIILKLMNKSPNFSFIEIQLFTFFAFYELKKWTYTDENID